MSRRAVTSILASAALLGAAAPADAAVTIGSNLGSDANSNNCGAADCTTTNIALPADVAPNGLLSPVTGTVTSWRFKSGSNGNTVSLRVLRPGGGVTFAGAGTSAAVTSASGINGPFATSLPIRAGDHVGLNRSNGAIVLSTDIGGTQLYWTMPTLADGASLPGIAAVNQEVLVQAVVEPSNVLAFGAKTVSEKKGSATITLTVPNAGQLSVAGKGVNVVGGAVRTVAPGEVTLTIKAKGKKAKKLASKGKVSLSPAFSFTPNNGLAASQTTKVALRKKVK